MCSRQSPGCLSKTRANSRCSMSTRRRSRTTSSRAHAYVDRIDQSASRSRLTAHAFAAVCLWQNVRLAARSLTFWYLNASLPVKGVKTSQPAPPTTVATLAFDVLPALFGSKIPAMPFRVVMAYPQDTACHHMGLAIHATRAVVLVKRGKCSFGAKMRCVLRVCASVCGAMAHSAHTVSVNDQRGARGRRRRHATLEHGRVAHSAHDREARDRRTAHLGRHVRSIRSGICGEDAKKEGVA